MCILSEYIQIYIFVDLWVCATIATNVLIGNDNEWAMLIKVSNVSKLHYNSSLSVFQKTFFPASIRFYWEDIK